MTTETSVAAPAQAKMQFKRRPLLIIIGLLLVLAAAGVAGYSYWLNTTLYVTTDDALIDSNMTAAASPGMGTLKSWQLESGMKVRAGQTIGLVKPAPSAGASSSIPVIAPIDGTVIWVDGKEGQVIAPAQPLAYIADLDHLDVKAYIDETDIHKIRVGQPVDVTVDTNDKTTYSGTIKEIVPAAASQFALLQTVDRTTANFTKVTQRVEVVIDLGSTAGSGLYPGTSASVRIHVKEALRSAQ